MVDLTEYERRGDLDAAFAPNKKHVRSQEESERIRRAVHCDLPRLTWDAYVDGAPCPGCGLPYRDEESFEFRGTMNLTDDARVRYDAEEARFKAAHGDCAAIRHSVFGSLTMHCGRCCPTPPLSPQRIASIGRILGKPTPPNELMRWRLRLFCGHIVEMRAHYTHKTLHSAFTGSVKCSECGADPATIVDGEAIGLAGEPPPSVAPASANPKRTRRTKAELEARIRDLEAEVERLRRR
ncbi:hypothetical protein [Nocardia cyriacigeorgica]|uniref:hypothetical protein n=1 Tax=Nocardia cyriacigeorgica TaxID=135487 RepID=UPI002457B027|nr:hypothetical protein [Nocardia cyriacigeorgica]